MPMQTTVAQTEPATIALPAIPVMAVNGKEAVILTPDGEIKTLPHKQAQILAHGTPLLVCHAPYTRAKLGSNELYAYDILELFAFTHPAAFAVPTPAGLAKTLGLPVPQDFEDYPFTIMEIAQNLLSDLQKEPVKEKGLRPLDIAHTMGLQGKGWPWTPFIYSAFGKEYDTDVPVVAKTTLNVWRHLPEWSEHAPEPPPAHHPVTEEESRNRLSELLGTDAEIREKQAYYAARATSAFAPKQERDEPALLLAEAGTGIGKTLGYLSPASVWAEKNDGTVWISTYTKNLQRQIDRELDRLYPDTSVKDKKIAVRKGRENYLCLLNMEDMITGAALAKHPDQVIAAGIMARWAEATKDGDLSGGDFPGWLPGLLGWKHSRGLSDTRGECIYAACDHYHKCFVERATRRANHADIVIANHALVMINTALSGPEDMLPQRYVFDEGHHLFDAADSAFAGHLTARETTDLRRWILGAEGGRRSRARGLSKRTEDLIAGDGDLETLLQEIIHHAHSLPAAGWTRRLKDGESAGKTEKFLHLVYAQVMARASGIHGPYSLETETHPLIDGLADAALILKKELEQLRKPMKKLSAALRKKLADHADTLDSDTKKRLESVAAGIDRRSEHLLSAWISMLDTLALGESPPDYIDWMEIERIEGRAIDVGLFRHWVNPMRPFAGAIKQHAHGLVITSATLRGTTGDDEEDWRIAEERTGAPYIASPEKTERFSVRSPFDYSAQTRILVVNDVNKNDPAQVASAYRALFEASQGGALGLFTSIQRLRAVHEKISQPLEEAGLPLYAQHIDGMDTGTLVDVFRDDVHACLLGTDAVRDGVDVPGEALRLLVYDRVPWPRPTILHKARCQVFGKQRHSDLLTGLKLQQAYGRLIRRAGDKGVFVMLDSALPTRLCKAFPDDVEIMRTGLAEAVTEIKSFL